MLQLSGLEASKLSRAVQYHRVIKQHPELIPDLLRDLRPPALRIMIAVITGSNAYLDADELQYIHMAEEWMLAKRRRKG